MQLDKEETVRVNSGPPPSIDPGRFPCDYAAPTDTQLVNVQRFHRPNKDGYQNDAVVQLDPDDVDAGLPEWHQHPLELQPVAGLRYVQRLVDVEKGADRSAQPK